MSVGTFFLSACNISADRVFQVATPTADTMPFSSFPVYQETIQVSNQITPSPLSAKPIKPIQLVWFHNAPLDDTKYPILANYFDIIEFTSSEEMERDRVKALGSDAIFINYMLFNAIRDEDPTTCLEQPYPARADYQIGDFCTIRDQNPDWFLKDRNGFPIESDFGGLIMDPANAEWREFWLRRVSVLEDEMDWDGVMLDNVEASADYVKKFSNHSLPSAFNEEEYISAIEEFLKFIYIDYFHPNDKLLFANIIGLKDQRVVFRYLPYLDGVMLENFAVDWEDGYLDPGVWEMQLGLAKQIQAAGKKVFLVAQGQETDLLRQEFSLASYLLINDGNAYFRYAYYGDSKLFPGKSAYVEVWMYKNYLLDLGQPLGSVYKQGNLWKRDFENGFVSVDPENHTAQFMDYE